MARSIYVSLKAEDRQSRNNAAVAAKGRDLSQFSHGLTGQHGTTASSPDTQQDADLGFWTAEH